MASSSSFYNTNPPYVLEPALSGTSTSSVTIGSGSRTFIVLNRSFLPGAQVIISADGSPSTNYMHGAVLSYDGTTLVVDINDYKGSGTFSSWTIQLSGTQGPQGLQGPVGPQGDPGVNYVTSVAGRIGDVVLSAADVSGLAASATTDTTDASNIASGTLNNARLSGVCLTANNLSDLANAGTARSNLALGSTDDVTHKSLTLAGGTLAVSAPSLDAAQTWNGAGVTFTGLKLNVTDTVSAAASLLLDLQVGGGSKFNIAKDGSAAVAGNITTSGASGDRLSAGLYVDSTRAQLRGIAYLGWSSSSIGGATDLSVFRDAANQLGQRNGTSAQKQSVYGTYTSSTNFERLSLDAGQTTANVLRLMAEKGSGGGSLRPIAIDGYSKAGAMVAGDIPQGTFAVFKDTSGGGVVLAYNDGGTLKTATLT